jgi:hypothetical protein
MKKRYLIVHDYGMGGVWGVMTARSGREICQKYPEVKILEVRPAWMSDANYNNILSNNADGLQGLAIRRADQPAHRS